MHLCYLQTSMNSVQHLCIMDGDTLKTCSQIEALCDHEPSDGIWMPPSDSNRCEICAAIDDSGIPIAVMTEFGVIVLRDCDS